MFNPSQFSVDVKTEKGFVIRFTFVCEFSTTVISLEINNFGVLQIENKFVCTVPDI